MSHDQLLIRSVKGDGCETRIDVLFKNVDFIYLPTLFSGLQIQKTGIDELRKVAGLHVTASQNVFRLTTKGEVGYVVAGAVFVHEDQGEYSDPSALINDEGAAIPWR